MRCNVLSSTYVELQKELHARPGGYGDKGDKWAPAVAALVTHYRATSVLDYGCGEGALAKALVPLLRPMVGRSIEVTEFDPAIVGKDSWPMAADLVVVTDVLEHVEPEYLSSVLMYLRCLALKAIFVVVSTRPAQRILSDGRNAHLIVEPDEWWLQTFKSAGFFVEPGPKSPLLKPSRELSVILT